MQHQAHDQREYAQCGGLGKYPPGLEAEGDDEGAGQ